MTARKEREELEDAAASSTSSISSARYKYSSTTIEDESPFEPQTTWGVDFNYRPTIFHMRRPGLYWKLVLARRGSLSPHSSNSPADSGSIRDEGSTIDDEIDEVGPPVTDTVDVLSDAAWINLFATVNRNCVRVYLARAGHEPYLLRVYKDYNSNEIYYTVTWTFNADGLAHWWVICAGESGVIRVIDVSSNAVVRTLVGHGNSVNDLSVHSKDPALLLSASKDESMRLWNMRTGATVAVFAGLKGHRGEVVSVDFDRDGNRFASCGIDYSIRVWDIIGDTDLVNAIADSHLVAALGTDDPYMYRDARGQKHRTRFVVCQFPRYVNRAVHKNYVDKVAWVGELLLSKSVHNRLLLTKPDLRAKESLAVPTTEFKLMEEFIVNGHKCWFIRFDLDRAKRLVAIGNVHHGISVYDIQRGGNEHPTCVLRPPWSGADIGDNYVRQCAFSPDASIIVAVDDKSRVIQYDRVEGPQRKPEPQRTAKAEDVMVE